jgi:integrase
MAASANSFEFVAREWHAMKLAKKWTRSIADKTMTQLKAYVFPEPGYQPIASVKASQILAALRKVERRGIAYTAVRLREVCGQIFRYGVATGRTEDNPAAHLIGALHKPQVSHRPAITERLAFGAFLRDLREATGYDPVTRYAAYFALLTFVRAQEFRYAKWEEIDWQAKEWKVPAKRIKQAVGNAHERQGRYRAGCVCGGYRAAAGGAACVCEENPGHAPAGD